MGLKKELGLLEVFSIASGAMISSGLFILPGLAYMQIGPAAILAYFVAGILIIPSLFSKAELATAMPKAGGDYFFINRSMGAGPGTIAGITTWFSLAFKSAFALLGIGVFVAIIFPSISYNEVKLIALFFCLLFMILNVISTRHSGKLQIFLVLGLLLILVLYIIEGISKVEIHNLTPFNHGTSADIFATAGLIFISYGGLTKIASVAEEIKNPGKNLPLGMILSFIIVTAIYVLVVFVTIGVAGEKLILPNGEPSLTPISEAAGMFSGKTGMIILAIAGLMAFISTGNAGIMAASRTPYAMSKDKLLPGVLGKLNKEYNTPHYSIYFTVAFMMAVIVLLDLEMLVKTASAMMLLLFALINLSVIVMRESRIQNYQPSFKSPLYPWLQIIAIFLYLFLIFEMGIKVIVTVGIFIVLGYIWYAIYGKIRTNRESALVYLVKRIKSSELAAAELETELREIIMERDSIQHDRFDLLIEICPVLDIKEAISKDDFFARIAGLLSEKLSCGEREIFQKLTSREAESSTVILPDLAIPHLIVSGENRFEIALVRARKGIYFSEENPAVRTVFVIAGSPDERRFHLQALAAIAQIVQIPDFQEKWLQAQNEDSLRDVITLAQRSRH
ncbi:MAG: amino acid permease [Candidatus Cloacimonetes bacterium]|nr:amino acid permease [Candidatus Cloacimonadota bacterium]